MEKNNLHQRHSNASRNRRTGGALHRCGPREELLICGTQIFRRGKVNNRGLAARLINRRGLTGRLHLPPRRDADSARQHAPAGHRPTCPPHPVPIQHSDIRGLARERWPLTVQVEHGENCKVGKTLAGRWRWRRRRRRDGQSQSSGGCRSSEWKTELIGPASRLNWIA